MGPIVKAVTWGRLYFPGQSALWFHRIEDYGLYMAMRENRLTDARAYLSIVRRMRQAELDQKSMHPLYPTMAEAKHVLLAYMGMDE